MGTRGGLGLACGLLLLGCAPVGPPMRPLDRQLAAAEPPDPARGYVAAISSGREGGLGYILVLSGDGGREYRFGLEPGPAPTPAMLSLAPGYYRIKGWEIYRVAQRTKLRDAAVPPDNALGRVFRLDAGQVVVLGEFRTTADVEGEGRSRRTKFAIRPDYLPADVALRTFRRAFPEHAAGRVSCLYCREPFDPADPGAELVPARP